MTDFEFIFVLYSLLLGFSMVALLGGLGRAMELHFARREEADFTIGWLSPLLAIFVMLDLLSFWVFAWAVRDQLTVSVPALLAVMSFAATYYLAACLVFPSEPERFADLDTHYFRVRRTVMLLLVTLVFVQWAYLVTIEALHAALLTPANIAVTALLIGLMLTAAFTRSELWSAVLLVALIVRYLVLYLAR